MNWFTIQNVATTMHTVIKHCIKAGLAGQNHLSL